MADPGSPRSRGHRIQLLQGSRELFPALIAAIDGALAEVRLETYIFDFNASGADVAHALMRAAERGVAVHLLVDGVGTGQLPADWRSRFDRSGVQWRVYAPLGALGYLAPSRWRRLHRKLCAVDGRIAFCGGINILDDLHDPGRGTLAAPRLDFALRARGALALEVRGAMARLWWRMQLMRDVRRRDLPAALDSLRAPAALSARGARRMLRVRRTAMTGLRRRRPIRALLLLRDNLRNRGRIERAYRKAIAEARQEIVIANAYFVPGAKLRRALVLAAQRGVRVLLLLQGRYESFMQFHATRPVYRQLLDAGVEIHEYDASFLHAKVAVIDGHWLTVGSSNLDPLSLLLAREANVVVDDAAIAADLRARLLAAMEHGGRRIDPADYENRPWRQRFGERIALALMRAALFLTGMRY
ncbi:MAG: cardiolipin synthase ClsB [Burkholderiaceae bacterium]|jgi:cardiolipin synthase|nr:MAG: cardiolipin synthase ClsB [Burkholderiaceae bacterium]